MRGVAMNQIDSSFNQSMSKADLLAGNFIAPVVAPVDRNHDDIAWLFCFADFSCDAIRSVVRQVRKYIDTGLIVTGTPYRRDSARCRAQRVNHNSSFTRQQAYSRSRSFSCTVPGTRMCYTGSIQCFNRLRQACRSPIKDVVVREATAIDPGCLKTADISWTHPVIYSFEPGFFRSCDGGLQIDDACIRCRRR